MIDDKLEDPVHIRNCKLCLEHPTLVTHHILPHKRVNPDKFHLNIIGLEWNPLSLYEFRDFDGKFALFTDCVESWQLCV